MYPHFRIMKSGRQPAHSSLRCRSSAVFLYLGHCPSFFRPFTFLGHCPSFSAHSHFLVIAPALLHSSVSGALPQLFCPFTFLGHCPSSSSLFHFWGNSTHAKKSEVLTSNVNRPARFHRTDPFTCMLVAIAPRPLSHENSRATPSSIQSALRLRQAVFTPSICHLLQSISCQTICCPYVHGFCS